jgi:hypothetical protein
MNPNTLNFMVDLLIPAKYKSILCEYNLKEMITFYGKKVATLSITEVEDIFKNFVLAGENFEKYFSKKSIEKYFPKFIATSISFSGTTMNSIFNFATLIFNFYSTKNRYGATRYEVLKANKYLENYIFKYNDLNESKIFK